MLRQAERRARDDHADQLVDEELQRERIGAGPCSNLRPALEAGGAQVAERGRPNFGGVQVTRGGVRRWKPSRRSSWLLLSCSSSLRSRSQRPAHRCARCSGRTGKGSRSGLEGSESQGRGKMDKEVWKAKRWRNEKEGIKPGRREWMRTMQQNMLEGMTYLHDQASCSPVRS